MEEKDNIKLEVGEIYAIDFIDLLSCKASPHMEESGKYPYYNMFLGLNSVKCNTNIELCNNFDEICIFVKYVDNGILEEMLTGKTILITSRECNLTAKSFVDFCDCQTQLASVYNSPLIVNSNKIHEVSKDSLDEYLNNKTPELFELLWDEAKKEFHDSLKSFSTLNWQDVLRDDVRYRDRKSVV